MQTKRNYFNNSKVANSIGKLPDLSTPCQISEFGKNKSNLVSYVNFDSKNVDLQGSSLSRYEMAVMDAAYTILMNGKNHFTPEQIANIMTGKEVKVSDMSTNIKQIAETIERLSMIRIKIDCTDVMREKGVIKPNAKMVVTGYLMPVTGIYVSSQVKKMDKIEYRFDRKPVLYEYAEYLGRVISVPHSLLRIEGINESTEFVVLKQEIIKEIAIMKNENNRYNSRDIIYEWDKKSATGGLFSRIGITKENFKNSSQWAKKRCKLHSQVILILDSLVEKKYISEYSIKKEGKTITGVSIQFNEFEIVGENH